LYNGSLDVLEEVSAEIVDVDFKHELLQKEKIVFCGSGSKKFEVINNNDNSVFDFDIQPSTQNMIEISYKKFKNKEFEDNAYFEPFYLKDFIAIKPKNKMF
jgi:tRNA threonylcarbamoyladenosine biosynthesis protein TsaB